MPYPDLALSSRRVAGPDGLRPATVLIADGRVVDVVDPADAPRGHEDLGDLVILPGLVDSHVHVNDPGRAHWEGFDSATRAAALGGVTTIVDMPLNCLPPTTSASALRTKLDATEGRIHVDVGFWGGIVPGTEDHVAELHGAGVSGFKVFTCDSGVAEYGSFAPGRLVEVLSRTAPLRIPLLVHAEDPDVLAAAGPSTGSDPRAYRTWLDSRPAAAEDAAVAALLDAVRATGGRAHVLHLSSPEAAAAIGRAKHDGLPVTAETCPHYLTIAAEQIPDGATDHKCAPPIRSRADQDRLWTALRDGRIDAVVSDHSPCPAADKRLDTGDFMAAWGGISSLQLGLPVMWSAARTRGIDLMDLVGWMSTAPARLAGLTRKGHLRPGADADLVVFDPDATWTVDPARLAHRHAVTPYAGRRLTGRVRRTYLRGRLIARDDALTVAATGAPLRRDES